MPGRKVESIRPTTYLQAPSVDDNATQRALDNISEAVQELQVQRRRAVIDYDLIVGTNKIPHGLGRRVAGYTLTATVADASFSHAIDKTNPNPERELWIVVIGAAQPGATIEVF